MTIRILNLLMLIDTFYKSLKKCMDLRSPRIHLSFLIPLILCNILDHIVYLCVYTHTTRLCFTVYKGFSNYNYACIYYFLSKALFPIFLTFHQDYFPSIWSTSFSIPFSVIVRLIYLFTCLKLSCSWRIFSFQYRVLD